MAKPRSRVRRDACEAVFDSLAHPARRRVLLAVYFNGGAMTAGEIAAMFAHAWQTTTRHLQVLEKAGLLSHERQGRTVFTGWSLVALPCGRGSVSKPSVN